MIDAYQTSGSSPTRPFEPLLDDEQAGEMLGLHPKTIQRLARRGEIPAVRIGRYWRYRASVLNQWIDPAGRHCGSFASVRGPLARYKPLVCIYLQPERGISMATHQTLSLVYCIANTWVSFAIGPECRHSCPFGPVPGAWLCRSPVIGP